MSVFVVVVVDSVHNRFSVCHSVQREWEMHSIETCFIHICYQIYQWPSQREKSIWCFFFSFSSFDHLQLNGLDIWVIRNIAWSLCALWRFHSRNVASEMQCWRAGDMRKTANAMIAQQLLINIAHRMSQSNRALVHNDQLEVLVAQLNEPVVFVFVAPTCQIQSYFIVLLLRKDQVVLIFSCCCK